MYNTLRSEFEIQTGKKIFEKNTKQIQEKNHLMNDEDIMQKIKESQTQKFNTEYKHKKPWISYQYIHPGQWVNL